MNQVLTAVRVGCAHSAGLFVQQKCHYLFTNVRFEVLPVVITDCWSLAAVLVAVQYVLTKSMLLFVGRGSLLL
jgi:Zn-dependent membrane protease YugP